MKVEFFHSVLCGHCFIMSNRIRKIVEKYPEIEIIHRSHPLRWDNSEDEIYTSEVEAKENQLKKWTIANKIDEESRFNLKGLKNMSFKYPTARRSMIAIQAGVFAGADEWDLFDRFQHALYVELRDIEDEDVIADIIEEAGIHFSDFIKYYEDSKTEENIKSDFELVKHYNLKTIPAMVVESKHVIEGTKRSDLALKLLKEAAQKEGIDIFN